MLPYCMMNILKTLPNVGLAAAFSRKGKGVDGSKNLMSELRFPGFIDSGVDHTAAEPVFGREGAVRKTMRRHPGFNETFPCGKPLITGSAPFFGHLVLIVYIFHVYNIIQNVLIVNREKNFCCFLRHEVF